MITFPKSAIKFNLLITKGMQYHTSNTVFNKQPARAMKKIMGGNKKKHFHRKEIPYMPNSNIISKTSDTKGNSKRATVLNKMFMKNITDLMANGSCSTDILGLGIEISRVQVAPDYKHLSVFWIAKGTKTDEVSEQVLEKNAWQIRHELSQLRVMGEVPIIKFVKDKKYSKMVELDEKLQQADYGDDYEPSEFSDKLKTELQLLTALETNVKAKIEHLDQSNTLEECEEIPLPAMPQNVLGLNHADIMNRINVAMNKSQALHRKDLSEETWASFKVKQPINENPIRFDSAKSQRDAFKEFLYKRQILISKTKQTDKNYSPDVEYIQDELRERHLNSLNQFTEEMFGEDYIFEDCDEDKNK